jgi:hypothetical protein
MNFLGPFALLDRLLQRSTRDGNESSNGNGSGNDNDDDNDNDKRHVVRVVYTGSDAFAFSSLHYHQGSKASYESIWRSQTNACRVGHGYEYVMCRFLGGDQHAKAKLGNLYHVIAMPSMYPLIEGTSLHS